MFDELEGHFPRGTFIRLYVLSFFDPVWIFKECCA